MALVDLDLRELELVARLLGEKHAIGIRALRTREKFGEAIRFEREREEIREQIASQVQLSLLDLPVEPPADLPEDGSIDAGLLLLELATEPGGERTLEEIAIACGVNRQKIHWIERRALKKLRAGFAARGILEVVNG